MVGGEAGEKQMRLDEINSVYGNDFDQFMRIHEGARKSLKIRKKFRHLAEGLLVCLLWASFSMYPMDFCYPQCAHSCFLSISIF